MIVYYYGAGSATEDPVKLWHVERELWRAQGTRHRAYGAVLPAGGHWQSPVPLSAQGAPPPSRLGRLMTTPLRARSRPSVAFDGRGNAVAVWPRASAGRLIVEAAVCPAGGVWQAPVDLPGAGHDASDPHVAVDPHGNAVAVWVGGNGADLIVRGAVRPAGGLWHGPVDLSTTGQNAFLPQVALDQHGNAVAVWRACFGTRRSSRVNTVVQAAVRPVDGPWQPPVDLIVPGTQRNPTQLFANSPSLAVDSKGDAVAVWAHAHRRGSGIQSATRPAGGAWQAPVDVSGPGDYAADPRVAVDPRGNAAAVWVTGTFRLQGAVRPVGGDWQAPVDISPHRQHASAPRVVLDAQGNATAVWRRAEGLGSRRIPVGAVRPAGEAWRAPVDLCAPTADRRERRRCEARTGPDALHPQVAVDPRGNTVAVWSLPVATQLMAQAAVRPAGGAWQASVNLSIVGHDAFNPQVALDPQGNAVAVWLAST